jgi:3-dehydroquinate synthase
VPGDGAVFVLVDETVSRTWGHTFNAEWSASDRCSTYVLTARESSKSIATLGDITAWLLAGGADNASTLVAVGGGVVGNIATMAASLTLRGCRLIHVPTTLIAQVDSAVDVKGSVNHAGVKNALGVIHPPDAVVVDPQFLMTLDRSHLLSGYGEILKHGLIQDPDFARWAAHTPLRDPVALRAVIRHTLGLKTQHYDAIVGKWDERRHERLLTHAGHVVAKACEVLRLDALPHGIAVAHGLVVETAVAQLRGLAEPSTLALTIQLLGARGLLTTMLEGIRDEALVAQVFRGRPTVSMALMTAPGAGTAETEVTAEELRAGLQLTRCLLREA